MKTVINLFHPDFNHSRVNKALATTAMEQNIEVRNLYDLYPNFKIDIDHEQRVLEGADRIILQFPIRWYSGPALLKQWEDDVLTYGWAYGGKGTALHDKELAIAATVGANNYGRENFVKYTVNELLRPFQATSRLVGTNYLIPFKVMGASTISDEDLVKATHDYQTYLSNQNLPTLGDFE